MAESGAVRVTPGRHGKPSGEPGLRVRPYVSNLLVSLIARRNSTAALSAAANILFGAELPLTPRWVAGRNVSIFWNGPGHWLVESHEREPDFNTIETSIADYAAVVDQTDSRITLEVSGPRVREVLAKGLPIDLHYSRFQVGDVALTSACHIGVQIWQTDPAPMYRLSVARSYFASFWQWLAASGAEYGTEVSA